MKNVNNASYVEFMISRSPKKNHEALLKLEKKSAEMLKLDISKFDLTQLDSLTYQRPDEDNK